MSRADHGPTAFAASIDGIAAFLILLLSFWQIHYVRTLNTRCAMACTLGETGAANGRSAPNFGSKRHGKN
jgi:hypothetical protein